MPPTESGELADLVVAFLDGDDRARTDLPHLVHRALYSRARRLAPPDFEARQLLGDVIARTWDLLLRKPPGSYDPHRGPALAYLYTVLRTAIRDVRQENARLIDRTRTYRSDESHPGAQSADPTLDVAWDGDIPVIEAVADLRHATATLPPDVQQAVEAIALDDATFVHAAQLAGLTRFALKRRLQAWATDARLASAA